MGRASVATPHYPGFQSELDFRHVREVTGLKVLVTGAGGFLASHVARVLNEDGFDVTGLDICRSETNSACDRRPLRDLGTEETQSIGRARRGTARDVNACEEAHPTGFWDTRGKRQNLGRRSIRSDRKVVQLGVDPRPYPALCAALDLRLRRT